MSCILYYSNYCKPSKKLLFELSKSKIKEDTIETIRCIPFDENPKNLNCIYSGGPAKHEVIYAKAY